MTTKLKDLTPILVLNYFAGVNTFIRGKPALGKTATINAFVEKMQAKIEGFKCWAFYAPTMSPMDIQASAPNYDTKNLDLFNNAALPNFYTDPDIKGCVFLGELPNTDPATSKLLQKYVNGEDMSGVLRKPPGVVIIADGNRIEDKSGVQQQGRAFLSRFEQLDVYTDANDCIEYAAKHSWHPFVQTFFKDNAASIDNYDEVFEVSTSATARSSKAQAANGSAGRMTEEGKQGIWANMRSWERISRKEYAAESIQSRVTLAEAVGNLGQGVGSAYDTHKNIMMKLTSFDDVLAMPEKAPVPEKMDEKYMMAMMIGLRCTMEQLPAVAKYAKRLPYELQAVTLKHIAHRKAAEMVSNPTYVEWISDPKLGSLLTGR